jgi:hypothetical protein
MRKEVTPLESQPLQSQQYTPSRKIVESFNDLHAPPCDEENSVRIITKLTPSRSTSDSIASAIKENDVTTSVNSAAEKGPSASIESETPRRTVTTQSPSRISSSSEKKKKQKNQSGQLALLMCVSLYKREREREL